MYTIIRHELRHARKAWLGTLVDPCLLSVYFLYTLSIPLTLTGQSIELNCSLFLSAYSTGLKIFPIPLNFFHQLELCPFPQCLFLMLEL
jgi:hypothetical protein